LPAGVSLLTATLLTHAEGQALANATDFDALHPLSDTAGALFDTFAPTLPFTVAGGVVSFDLPEPWRTLPPSTTLRVAARATITRAHHGPNRVGDGGTICYTDPFGVRWCDEGRPVVVEAAGAVVGVDYFCEGGSAGVLADGAGDCTVPPGETSQITLRVTAYNEGDMLARAVTATLELAAGVTPVGSLAPQSFGDVAPGGWVGVRVTLEVTPTGDVVREDLSGWYLPVVDRTWGQFLDTASQRIVSGQLGDDYAVGVFWEPCLVYLPVTLRNLDTRPDLVVTAIDLEPGDPAGLQVTIANQGRAAAREFWVDVYLDPISPPEVNQPWPDLGCLYGGAWFVEELAPRGSLTLAVEDAFYQDEYSRWPEAYPPGDHRVWAYVDAWGHPQPYGAVDEADEGNNRYGPVSFTVTGAAAAGSEPVPAAPVPPRPRRPGGGE
jgi:hypothetical protein